MANRDTMTMNDIFGVSPLIATSSIYPATQAASPVLPTTSRPEELDNLLPWGCEQTDQAVQDQA